jgi:hypothetical protein
VDQLRSVIRPTKTFRRMLGRMDTPRDVRAVLEDATAIGAFARLLEEQILKHTKPGGSCDLQDVAAAVLAEMGRHQR